jgi:hypothetical protein
VRIDVGDAVLLEEAFDWPIGRTGWPYAGDEGGRRQRG